MNELRFGLVGHGLWGTHHGRAIARTRGAKLVAVAERAEEGRAAAKAEHPQADVYDDYRKLVARDDIDVVDIVVPSHLHFEVAAAALDSGKHVLVEKPMVLTVAQCDELIGLARRQGKILAVDHEMRLSILWGRVKRMIDEGLIGTPLYVLTELSRFPYRFGSEGWRFDIKRVGSWMLEEPIHFFDLARWYLSDHGEPVSIYARANSKRPDHPELQDNFSAIINFAGGAYAVISQTLAAFEHHCTVKVTGTEGAAWAYWSAPDARHAQPTFALRYITGDDPHQVHEVPFGSVTGEVVELQQQIAALLRSVREGVPPIATAEDGKWAVVLCLAAQRSIDEGRPVEIEEMAG